MIVTSNSILKKLLIAFLLVAGLYYAKAFLMPITIAGVLATLFLPLSRSLEKQGLPRGLSSLICLLALLIVMAGIVSLISWQVTGLIDDFELIKIRLTESLHRIQQYIMVHLGMSLEQQMEMIQRQGQFLPSTLTLVAGSMAQVLTTMAMILVYIFCLLYYRGHLKQFLLRLSPPGQKEEMESVIYSTSRVSQQYMLGLSKMIVCLWILYGIGFSIIGVQNAIFFAVLCGLLEIVPYIGNLTGTLLTVLVAAVNGAGFPVLGSIVVVYGCIQLFQGWVLEPVIVGPQVKINPFTTIVALVLGELIWGIAGIFLAIPVIAMLKIIFDHIESLRAYGHLIGETDSGKDTPGFVRRLRDAFRKGTK
ncbi:MAG: AI-2E family transporter [Bacteroidia bacterium]|nr:AI-2E family transporter [Bacteroidia bacterium]